MSSASSKLIYLCHWRKQVYLFPEFPTNTIWPAHHLVIGQSIIIMITSFPILQIPVLSSSPLPLFTLFTTILFYSALRPLTSGSFCSNHKLIYFTLFATILYHLFQTLTITITNSLNTSPSSSCYCTSTTPTPTNLLSTLFSTDKWDWFFVVPPRAFCSDYTLFFNNVSKNIGKFSSKAVLIVHSLSQLHLSSKLMHYVPLLTLLANLFPA